LKVKRSDLLSPSGGVPRVLAIDDIKYQIAGMTVRVHYNNENDEEVAVLYDGTDHIRFPGGFIPEDDDQVAEGGDICFTTENETSGDSYMVTMTIRPKD
jgi:hypothetical protein